MKWGTARSTRRNGGVVKKLLLGTSAIVVSTNPWAIIAATALFAAIPGGGELTRKA